MSVTTFPPRPATAEKVSAREASEWVFVGITIFIVFVLTSLPYLFAYITTPADKQFMGIMLDVPDHTQYFSWMHDLAQANLVPNRLTPEPNRAIFFNLLWWMLGRLGRLLNAGYPVMYQLLRFAGAVLFLLLAYRVCGWFLSDRRQRRLAFLIIALTSGFGWVLILLKYTLAKGQLPLPLDVYIAEGNTFLDIMAYPHFMAAALYIFVFDLMLRGRARGRLIYAIFAGLVALFLGWQHAYDLVLVYGILGFYVVLKILRDRRLPVYLIYGGLILGLISWWPAIYSVLLTRADPVWKQVLAQFANAGVYTPPPWQLPILLGIPLLIALLTVILRNPLRLRGWSDNDLFLLAWLVGNLLLIYIPTDFQIHMLNGIQVPIAILAASGFYRYILPNLERLYSRLKAGAQGNAAWLSRASVAFLLLAILPTNLYLWSWRFFELSQHTYPYYLYKDEISAFSWLSENGSINDVVLSSLMIGQYVPMMTGKHAFLAHWAQTLDFYGKQKLVQEFFNIQTSDSRRQEILIKYDVNYIFYGPQEKQIGSYSPGDSPMLQKVYSNSLVTVYKVNIHLNAANHALALTSRLVPQ